ncbi:MAG: regulatory signaling modulator protein AmpE [Oceanicoccus sp.]|uniref:regulatory signaling modulator protein AmpE n=1 Tax=Oceanicoccus sp. TaxID=2691044 RepID=UPI00262938AE|nr:regulatory signaling modulator protein AmpE [Oceanicoccus sp.]MCP3906644.1 regulatory signaling modulator protein AmpE [Oceanicoccus sp.]MDG1772551.1 regulatory signaling modulator protein AmpE [Oceanicoccus sp.]
MEFLTVLIVLGFLQLWGSGGPLQRDDWFYQFNENIPQRLSLAELRLLAAIGIPAVGVFLLQDLLESVLFGLLSLIFYVTVLLFSLGRGDFNQSLQNYLASWNKGDFEGAYNKATAIGDFEQSETSVDHVALHEHVRRAFLHEGFERWFAVVFWFLVLGPVGAVIYRLGYLAGRHDSFKSDDKSLALQWLHYFDWVPVRLLALSFSMTGNFVSSFNRYWSSILDNQPTSELLDQCAVAAISGSDASQVNPTDKEHFIDYGREELLTLQSLLSRSVIFWVIIIAVVTLIAG